MMVRCLFTRLTMVSGIAMAAISAAVLFASDAMADLQLARIPNGPISGFATQPPVDMLGVSIGMSYSDALAKLNTMYPEVHNEPLIFDEEFIIRDRKFLIESSAFTGASIATYKERSVIDSLKISYSMPSSGSAVIGASRTIAFDKLDDQPSFDAFIAELTRKYGNPTYSNVKDDKANLCWVYSAGQPRSNIPCDNIRTDFAPGDFHNEEFDRSNVDLAVSASVTHSKIDPSRASAAKLLMMDVGRYKADIDSYSALVKELKKDLQAKDALRMPAPVPKL